MTCAQQQKDWGDLYQHQVGDLHSNQFMGDFGRIYNLRMYLPYVDEYEISHSLFYLF